MDKADVTVTKYAKATKIGLASRPLSRMEPKPPKGAFYSDPVSSS